MKPHSHYCYNTNINNGSTLEECAEEEKGILQVISLLLITVIQPLPFWLQEQGQVAEIEGCNSYYNEKHKVTPGQTKDMCVCVCRIPTRTIDAEYLSW